MSLADDITTEVNQIFADQWVSENTNNIPDPEDIRLNNHVKNLDAATVLYADIDGSTKMVDTYTWQFSAEIYKVYLRCAAKIIRSEGAEITAYDGDRIMAIFIGDSKNTTAVRSAMKINYAVENIIKPGIAKRNHTPPLSFSHRIGIDTSTLKAARIGVRGYNDLVWVGRAANYAAKLTECTAQKIFITNEVYGVIADNAKFCNGVNMWEKYRWTSMNNLTIYGSSYVWSF